ncbi:MAG TPA: hypothetical protein VNO50_06515 [Pyrinomonadaceae bacterium]|nr:hypothetical protein [Pyrinomonadaceae bacterium]
MMNVGFAVCQDEITLRGVAVSGETLALQIDCKWKPENEGIAGGDADFVRPLSKFRIGLTTSVLAITTYLGDMRLLGFLAVFAAILAVLFRGTIASWMSAFVYLVLCHKTILPFEMLLPSSSS